MDSIGSCQFVALHGNPEGPRTLTELIARPGVDGVGLWDAGARGQKFTLRSGRDIANTSDAEYWLQTYRNLIADGLQDLVHADISYASEGWRVLVLDVRRVRVVPLLTGVGGFDLGGAWLEADWDLIAVAI